MQCRNVLSSIAASDPRQVPVGTFHLAVQAHTYISASLEKKKQEGDTRRHQQQDVTPDIFGAGGTFALTQEKDVFRAASVLSAVRLVPVSSPSSSKLGQKRPRSDDNDEDGGGGGIGRTTTNQLYAYNVSALHNLTSGIVRTPNMGGIYSGLLYPYPC